MFLLYMLSNRDERPWKHKYITLKRCAYKKPWGETFNFYPACQEK